jgi:N-acetyl-gamma-glutamyl-phosphate reductase
VHSRDLDVVFLALPHGESQAYVPFLLERGVQVVDLGADFRLRQVEEYQQWYGHEHAAPHLLALSVYGLVERHRDDLKGASFIAVPGCYPTASALALGPFIDADVIARDQIVVNALSGVSGAGRATSERLHFSRLAGNAEAYGLLIHRHTPEIQQELGATLLFTPHLVPVSRGMLVSAYGRVASPSFTTADAMALLRSTYADDPCVVVTDEPPALKDPLGSNLCFVSARVDERTGWLLAMSSLDNLTKGAAGQAIQAWNVATGREETLGLPLVGVTP